MKELEFIEIKGSISQEKLDRIVQEIINKNLDGYILNSINFENENQLVKKVTLKLIKKDQTTNLYER